MGDNDAAMRDIAALQGGSGQNHIQTVTGVGDLVTVVSTGAQVPNRTFMAETRYPSAVRLPTQSCQSSAAVFIMQTSDSLEQVKRYAIAVEELKVGQVELEENFSSFQQQVNEESHEFGRFAALILNRKSEERSMI